MSKKHALAVDSSTHMFRADTQFAVRLLDGSGDGMFAFDRQFRCALWNPAMQRMTGTASDRALGHDVREVFPPIGEPPNAQALADAWRGSHGLVQCATAGATNANPRDLEIRWSPVRDERGEVTHVLAVVRERGRQDAEANALSVYEQRLRALASELSLCEERQRRELAAAVHDGVAQSVAGARIKINALARDLPPAVFAERMAQLDGMLDEAARQARLVVSELSPPVLYELGFVPAIEWLADLYRERFGLAVRVLHDGRDIGLSEAVRITLFQAVRELLMNVVKHAKAPQANVSISKGDSNVEVVVADDGVGIDPSQMNRVPNADGGFGLFNVRERLSYLGGTIRLDASVSAGTRLVLTAPLGDPP